MKGNTNCFCKSTNCFDLFIACAANDGRKFGREASKSTGLAGTHLQILLSGWFLRSFAAVPPNVHALAKVKLAHFVRVNLIATKKSRLIERRIALLECHQRHVVHAIASVDSNVNTTHIHTQNKENQRRTTKMEKKYKNKNQKIKQNGIKGGLHLDFSRKYEFCK